MLNRCKAFIHRDHAVISGIRCTDRLTDPTAHIGIRMIYKMAKEIKYINTLKTNNLILTV